MPKVDSHDSHDANQMYVHCVRSSQPVSRSVTGDDQERHVEVDVNSANVTNGDDFSVNVATNGIGVESNIVD